jgi:hypothetical protein
VQAVASYPAPTNLSASWTNATTVTVSWSSPNPTGCFYVYYRDVDRGTGWTRLSLPTCGRTFQPVVGVPRHNLSFHVTEAGNGGESAPSADLFVAQPPSPYAYTAAVLTCTTYAVTVRLPGGAKIRTGWVEVIWAGHGITPFPGAIWVSFAVTRNGGPADWTGGAAATTTSSGYWFAGGDPNRNELNYTLGRSRWDLSLHVQGPYGENWGNASSSCTGG